MSLVNTLYPQRRSTIVGNQCSLCFKPIDDPTDRVTPCPCRAVAHHTCLVLRVFYHERYGLRPRCPFCATPYTIYPDKGLFLSALQTLDCNLFPRFSTMFTRGLRMLSFDLTIALHGVATLWLALGSDDVKAVLLPMNTVLAWLLCSKFVILLLILVYKVPWELTVLRILRRCSNVPVLGYFFPVQNPNADEPDSRLRSGDFAVLLFLPVFAKIIGDVLFPTTESNLRRFLLGGAVFVGAKGLLIMYYTQKLYVRSFELDIADYISPENSHSLENC